LSCLVFLQDDVEMANLQKSAMAFDAQGNPVSTAPAPS
jgi:hypothetical protein